MRRQIIVLFALWKITIYIFCLALFCLGLGIVRFCSKTSMARLVIFCILSQHFFCINLTEYLIVCWDELSAELISSQLYTVVPSKVCSLLWRYLFVLFWNIENRDGIIGTLRNTEEHRDQICIVWRRQGWACWFHDSSGGWSIMFNLFVISENWFRLAKKKSRHEIDQKRTQPISSHNKTQVGDEKKEDF